MFFHCKYHRGHWLFGNIKRCSAKCFLVDVPDRRAETLKVLIVQYIQPETILFQMARLFMLESRKSITGYTLMTTLFISSIFWILRYKNNPVFSALIYYVVPHYLLL